MCFSFSPLHLIKVWSAERWRENVQKWWHELPPKDLETAPVRQLLYLGVNSSDPSLLPHVKKKKPDVTTSVLWFRAPDCLPCWEPSHTIRLGIIQKKAECVLVFFKAPSGWRLLRLWSPRNLHQVQPGLVDGVSGCLSRSGVMMIHLMWSGRRFRWETCNFSWCDGLLFLLSLMLEMHLRLVYCAFWSVLSTFYMTELSDSAFRRFFLWYTHVTQFKKVFLLLKESIYSRLE